MSRPEPTGRMNTGVAILLALVAIVFLFVNAGGLISLPQGASHVSIGHWSWNPFGMFYGMLGVTALIQLILAVWVGVDAHRNGANGFLWGVLVFFTPVIGLIVYLLMAHTVARRQGGPDPPPGAQTAAAPARPASPAARETCPSCRGEIEPDYKVCPVCGASLRCSSCDKPIRSGWKVCPYCAVPIAGEGD